MGDLGLFPTEKKGCTLQCDTGDKLWPIKRNHHQLRVSSQKSALLTPSYDDLRFCCCLLYPPFLYLIFGSSEPQNLPNVRQVHLPRSLEIGMIKEFGIGLSSSEEL